MDTQVLDQICAGLKKNLPKFSRLVLGVAIGIFLDHLAEIPAKHRLGNGVAIGRLLFGSKAVPFGKELVRDRRNAAQGGQRPSLEDAPQVRTLFAGALGLHAPHAVGQDLHGPGHVEHIGFGNRLPFKHADPLGIGGLVRSLPPQVNDKPVKGREQKRPEFSLTGIERGEQVSFQDLFLDEALHQVVGFLWARPLFDNQVGFQHRLVADEKLLQRGAAIGGMDIAGGSHGQGTRAFPRARRIGKGGGHLCVTSQERQGPWISCQTNNLVIRVNNEAQKNNSSLPELSFAPRITWHEKIAENQQPVTTRSTMFDQTENGRDGSVAKQGDEAPASGSVAEPVPPSTAENTLGTSPQDAAVSKAGFVAGLSSSFEVDLADLNWNADTSDPDALQSLGASLKVLQINDIIVSPNSTAGKHGVIAGNRRCAAAALAGLTRLRARIYQGNASEIVSVVENAQRLDETPKSLLLRLRKALQGGTDRQEVREFLGETGKAKSTISDLLYGAQLDESRFQEVIDSPNVFKAIANLRKRKPAPATTPAVKPPAQLTASADGHGELAPEQEKPAESAPAGADAISQPPEERLPAPSSVAEEEPPAASNGTEMLHARNGSVAERPVDPIPASKWASWREVESGLTEAKSETEASANASQYSGLESGELMVMEQNLRVALAECAQTDEEKAAAGDWSLAMVRPSGSRNVPVDRALSQNAIAEMQRRCTGDS